VAAALAAALAAAPAAKLTGARVSFEPPGSAVSVLASAAPLSAASLKASPRPTHSARGDRGGGSAAAAAAAQARLPPTCFGALAGSTAMATAAVGAPFAATARLRGPPRLRPDGALRVNLQVGVWLG
jgi:hypothetical protein